MIEIPESIRIRIIDAVRGNNEAMGILFEWFRPRLYAHALRICGNKPIAQDIVQDTFIAAFTNIHSLKDSGSFYPWLKKILVNNCYRHFRSRRTEQINEGLLKIDALLHQSLDEYHEKVSNNQRIHKALLNLSDEIRSVVLLRYFSSLKSYEEIAKLFSIPVGTVRSRLASGREQLTNHFFNTHDAGVEAVNESRYWSSHYTNQWNNLHRDPKTRSEFINHLHPSLKIRFTSGLQGIGRRIIEGEINNDLIYGSSVVVREVNTSGNISVIEADNINSPEFPDRCAPTVALVLFRKDDIVETAHIFDSPRP